MTARSAEHATFTIERTYDASPGRVFAAWADPQIKPRWFNRGAPSPSYKLDFRVGGSEINVGGPPGGDVYTYRATFQEIVPNERFVSTYTMDMNDTRISISVATVEFAPAGKQTRFTYTEQCVYLDGHDNAQQREDGCTAIVNALSDYLATSPVSA